MRYKPLARVYEVSDENKKIEKEIKKIKEDKEIIDYDINDLYVEILMLKEKNEHIEKYLKKSHKDYKSIEEKPNETGGK